MLVLAPKAHVAELPALGPDVRVVAYTGLDDATAALRGGAEPAVIWSDGLFQDAPTELASTVHDRPGPCVEVRAERWDGRTPSHLSAACRGVISGFGADGVARAVELLRRG